MGYCLHYQTAEKTDNLQGNRTRVAALTLVSALLFVFLVNLFWPNGRAFLAEFLFGERTAVAAAAVDGLAVELENGVAFEEAVKTFVSKLLKK